MQNNKLYKSGEDYLEAIFDISQTNQPVRCIDIAHKLQVSRPSVNKAIGKLRENGYLEQELYGTVTLTESGKNRAKQVRSRHSLISSFLIQVLGVDATTAEQDACKMEHDMSDTTIEKLSQYCDQFIKNKP